MRRPARWVGRWGMRRRVTVGFALLSLILSLVLSSLAWVIVTRAVVREARATALAATSVDAGQLEARMAAQGTAAAVSLEDLPRTQAVAALANVADRWYASAPTLGPSVLPDELRRAVRDQHVATQRVAVGDTLYLVVGMPVPGRDASFFEVYPMAGASQASRSLSAGLAAATVVTVLLGVGLGRLASRVALRPLGRLNEAAAAVAAGRLGVRLDGEDDPDLVPITDSFNATVADLDRRVVADARFATDVSHELRTPLTTMLNSMQVILNREDRLPDDLREPVSLLSDELARFRHLVTDLLEIARHEAGDQLVLEPVRVADLVRRAADGEAGRSVTEVGPGAAEVVLDLDKRRLERVVANLVRNAEGHGGGCTGVRVLREEALLRVVVEDDGPGVDPEQVDRIFDRFARGRGTTSSGVGLGLAIVQRHVALHGGTVEVAVRPEGGARFVVELPLAPPH
ncbi:HAMP domain-containing histidine kinase [Phycicoccus sp. HDW14]|uniref:sensor histidine kinase n=1 Tax=Phycicoccus sp. HDW14 TaxID=2714941 RepID=UPI00140C829D|nr:HAMP domain-containing sensor histidine kinase [Phycicoccus sp. HDW14]QIM20965.1 HAMP domain-containing histidine kinase [Phycicoccus sp. HDW14]